MIRAGQPVTLQSEDGLILMGTVMECDPDDGISVITDSGDEWELTPAGDDFVGEDGKDWVVIHERNPSRPNPCLPCIGLNPKTTDRPPNRNPMAYEHLPEPEQEKLLGLMEASQQARVRLSDARIRGDKTGAKRWGTKLHEAEKQLTAAERQYGAAYLNPRSRKKKRVTNVRSLVAKAMK